MIRSRLDLARAVQGRATADLGAGKEAQRDVLSGWVRFGRHGLRHAPHGVDVLHRLPLKRRREAYRNIPLGRGAPAPAFPAAAPLSLAGPPRARHPLRAPQRGYAMTRLRSSFLAAALLVGPARRGAGHCHRSVDPRHRAGPDWPPAPFMKLHSAKDAAAGRGRLAGGRRGRDPTRCALGETTLMRMRAVKALDLPAGRAVELKPGGYHVMLMDLKQQNEGRRDGAGGRWSSKAAGASARRSRSRCRCARRPRAPTLMKKH